MSTTKVSDKVAKRRLLALADKLEAIPENQFDFGTFGEVPSGSSASKGTDILKESNFCGTTACALGWAPALPFAKKMGFANTLVRTGDYTGTSFTKNGRIVGPYQVAKALFGLSTQAFSFLFHPDSHMGGMTSPKSDAFASDVAEHIRNYVSIRYA